MLNQVSLATELAVGLSHLLLSAIQCCIQQKQIFTEQVRLPSPDHQFAPRQISTQPIYRLLILFATTFFKKVIFFQQPDLSSSHDAVNNIHRDIVFITFVVINVR